MKVISFLNLKGGVAKTVSAHNVAAYLNSKDKKTLLIDWDPQSDLSFAVLEEDQITKTAVDMIKGTPAKDCIIETEEFDIIANWDEKGLQNAVKTALAEDQGYLIYDRLGELAGYDYIIIDCPPTEGDFPLNALVASNYVFIPFVPEDSPVKQAINTVNLIKKLQRRGVDIKFNLFATMVSKSTSLHLDNLDFIKNTYKDMFLESQIPRNIRLAELPRVKQSIFKYSPNSKGAISYKKLCEEMMEVMG